MDGFAKLLTKGLRSGYAGNSTISEVSRAHFIGKQSHVEFPEGVYHDEWFAKELGGGQELVQIGKERFTRVYAGGTVEKSILDSLGITSEDVIHFLIKKVNELGEKTRLATTYKDTSEGDWQYEYTILDTNQGLITTVGKEEILYKETIVFIHWFILSPIK